MAKCLILNREVPSKFFGGGLLKANTGNVFKNNQAIIEKGPIVIPHIFFSHEMTQGQYMLFALDAISSNYWRSSVIVRRQRGLNPLPHDY